MAEEIGLSPDKEKYDDGCKKVKICDDNELPISINSDRRIDIVQHSHPDQGTVHFHNDISSSENYTLIDISNTTDFPHSYTNYAHIEWIRISVDPDNQADYELKFVFLENVDSSNSDIYTFTHVFGNKAVGQSKELFFKYFPNGFRCISSKIATHDVSLNDITFQDDVNQKTVLNTGVANTPSGNGDVILMITVNAGSFNLIVDLSYHSH